MASESKETEAPKLTIAEQQALDEGIEKAALLQEEHDSRPDDHPDKMAEDAMAATLEAQEEAAEEEPEPTPTPSSSSGSKSA